MKAFVLAAFAALSLGLATANAAVTSHAQTHSGNYYNWLEGGGG
jgi:hypothetical protein